MWPTVRNTPTLYYYNTTTTIITLQYSNNTTTYTLPTIENNDQAKK